MDLLQIERAKNAAANGRLIVIMAFAVMLFAVWRNATLPSWPLLLPVATMVAAWAADSLPQSKALPLVTIALAAVSVGLSAAFLIIGV